ncbi:acriflavin resistance protein [Spirochaetia bacterium]|nr:acriflavin resistance protein [Spirochaetia bacterium]
MKGLIDLCVKRPVSVIMFLAAMILGGIFSLSVLPLQALPEFPFPQVTVETRYPGLGAGDIRPLITIPVEDALSSVKGLERMRSISRDGESVTVLDFRWGTDSGAASVLVREAIDAVYPSLPEGASKPAVIPGSGGEEAQLIVAVRSPLGGAFARNLAEYEIRSQLRRIDGVGTVILSGGDREELAIKVDLPRALSRGLPPAVLAEIISAETANVPAGNARQGDKELVVVSRGRPATEQELRSLVLPSQSGPFVIGDVGKIFRDRAKKESLFIASDETGKAREYAALEIYRRPGADPVGLSRDVQKALAEVSAAFGRDAEIRIIYDGAASIVPGLQKLFVSVVIGIIAVMSVLFVTLRNFRYSILAGLSLPVSMAASLAALAVLGRSLNNMSLSGIALGIGLVSDTSVIILDLLHGHFNRKAVPSYAELSGRAASVAASSFGGTLTTAIVFVPVVFLPGPLGSLFGDLSLALVVSVLAGWIYAQFALPALFRMFYSLRRVHTPPACGGVVDSVKGEKSGEEKSFAGIKYLEGQYAALLSRCVKKPLHVLGITALLCVTGLTFLVTRPTGFVSADEAALLEAVLNFPPGTTMETIAAEASALGEKLSALPELSSVFGRAGSEEEDTGKRSDPAYRKETFIFRCMIAPRIKPETALTKVNVLLETAPCEALAVFPQDKTEKLLGLSSSAVLAVKGRDREEAENRAAKTAERIRESGLTAALTLRPAGSRPELRVVPDREASAHAGLSTVETARAFYAAAEGLMAGELELEGRPLKMKVSALELPELEGLPIMMGENGPVFAGSLTRIEYREAAAALARLDRSETVYIETSPLPGRGRALSAFLALLCSNEKEQGLGRADESAFARYRSSLILTVVLVILLLYLTMGAGFESLTLPPVLLLAIPFSLAGAGPALFLAGAGLDSSSVLALMVLFGLSVNSGMVLYELAAEKCKEMASSKKVQADVYNAVYQAALERFRPVLTTALTTAFALVPLVVSPLGAKEHSMAAAMLGGISASTTLTLFALPPVLIRFLSRRYVQKKRGDIL